MNRVLKILTFHGPHYVGGGEGVERDYYFSAYNSFSFGLIKACFSVGILDV